MRNAIAGDTELLPDVSDWLVNPSSFKCPFSFAYLLYLHKHLNTSLFRSTSVPKFYYASSRGHACMQIQNKWATNTLGYFNGQQNSFHKLPLACNVDRTND